ncbi:MAG: 50S ribosomal protein L23 [Salinibacterium sp.]|nr:50S ribosomal protein L23 [Salinibacterium sp.]
MMDATYIIKKPLLTEKTTEAMNSHGQYAFEVDRRADKPSIKAAIESLYGVRVLGVNTVITEGAHRRMKYGVVGPKKTKKALVRLHPDDTIELF